MTKSRPSITGTTHTLPFHQLSPREFERLCLWLVQREGYERAEHLGAADVSANTRQQACERCAGEMGCHFWALTELDERAKRHPDIVE